MIFKTEFVSRSCSVLLAKFKWSNWNDMESSKGSMLRRKNNGHWSSYSDFVTQEKNSVNAQFLLISALRKLDQWSSD